jgi:hypothetical protein
MADCNINVNIPDWNTMDLKQISRSVSAHKGIYTSNRANIIGQLATMTSNGATNTSLRLAQATMDGVNAKYNLIKEAYAFIISQGDDATVKAFSAKSEEITKDHNALQQDYSSTIHQCEIAMQRAMQGPRINQGGGNADLGAKLRPKQPTTLTKDCTPSDVRIWQESVRRYFSITKLSEDSIDNQHGYVLSYLDSQLMDMLRNSLSGYPDLKVFPDQGALDEDCVMQRLDDIFLQLYPLINRRDEFCNIKLQPGMTGIDLYVELDKAAAESKVHSMTGDEILVMQVIKACDVPDVPGAAELRREILKLEDPTYANVKKVLATWTRVNKIDATSVNKVNATVYKQRQQQQRQQATQAKKGGGGGKQKLSDRPDLTGRCLRCGDTAHTANNCPRKQGMVCSTCGARDSHLSVVCMGGGKSKANTATSQPATQSFTQPQQFAAAAQPAQHYYYPSQQPMVYYNPQLQQSQSPHQAQSMQGTGTPPLDI